MKVNCVFLLSCSTVINAVLSLGNKRYHVTVPSLSTEGTEDTEDRNQRTLQSSCTFGAGRYSCFFDSVLQGNSGDDVPINLNFDCDWDYSIGVDIGRTDCGCEAIIHPGTSDEQMCQCAGCRFAEMMARQPDGNAIVDHSQFGVAVDCSAIMPQPSFVVDDCYTLDCFGECNGTVGMPWLSTNPTSHTWSETEGTDEAEGTEEGEETDEAEEQLETEELAPTTTDHNLNDAAEQTSEVDEALKSINEATTDLAFGDLLTAVGTSSEKKQQIIELAAEMEKGDFTAEELQKTVIASNSIADQTSSTADVFFYSVIEGDMTVETVVRLNDAISVIVSVTDVMGPDIIAAVDNGILTADEVISVADGLTNNNMNANELGDFLDAVYAVRDATVGLAFTDIVNAVGNVKSANDEELAQLAANIKKGAINGEDLQDTVIASNTIGSESGREANVFFYSVINGDISVDTIMDLSEAFAVIMEVTDVSGEELFSAIDDEILSIDEVIVVAFDYVGAVVELGDLKDFIDAVRYLDDVVHEAKAEDGSANLEDFMEDLIDDVDDGVLEGGDLIDLAEAIRYIDRFTDVKGYEVILAINDGKMTIDEVIDIVDEMEDGNFEENEFEEFFDSAVRNGLE